MDETTNTDTETSPMEAEKTEETLVEVEPQKTSSQLAYDWIELYLTPVTGP